MSDNGARNPCVLLVGNLPKPVGGVATHCYQLASHLSALGVRVIFLDTHQNSDKNIPQNIEYRGLPAIGLRRSAAFLLNIRLSFTLGSCCLKYARTLGRCQIIRIWQIAQAVSELLKKHPEIALIHSQHCNTVSLAAAIVAGLKRKPLVVTAHGAEFSYKPQWQQYRRVIAEVCRRARCLVAVSQSTLGWVQKRGITCRTFVVYNGVAVAGQQTMASMTRRAQQTRPVILFAGELVDWKGPQFLIQAIPNLQNKTAVVRIVGRDRNDYLHYLENEIARLKLRQRVILVGEVSDTDLTEEYLSADIFVFPTCRETEGFGLTLADAMAFGKPVVASDIGPIPELVEHNITGLLVRPGDSLSLAEALDKLLKSKDIRQRLGHAARKKMTSNFRWENTARQTLAIYNSCISGHFK